MRDKYIDMFLYKRIYLVFNYILIILISNVLNSIIKENERLLNSTKLIFNSIQNCQKKEKLFWLDYEKYKIIFGDYCILSPDENDIIIDDITRNKDNEIDSFKVINLTITFTVNLKIVFNSEKIETKRLLEINYDYIKFNVINDFISLMELKKKDIYISPNSKNGKLNFFKLFNTGNGNCTFYDQKSQKSINNINQTLIEIYSNTIKERMEIVLYRINIITKDLENILLQSKGEYILDNNKIEKITFDSSTLHMNEANIEPNTNKLTIQNFIIYGNYKIKENQIKKFNITCDEDIKYHSLIILKSIKTFYDITLVIKSSKYVNLDNKQSYNETEYEEIVEVIYNFFIDKYFKKLREIIKEYYSNIYS